MATARMKAEKRLISFVRIVAFMERTDNGFGRLVLIWASVVVGFSKNLGNHFWYLAAIIILESFRAFSQESKSDDQLLFKTTGGIKIKRISLPLARGLYYVNAIVITSCGFDFILSFIPISGASSSFIGTVRSIPLLLLLNKAIQPALSKLIEKISRPENSYWFIIPPVFLMAATIARSYPDVSLLFVILLLWLVVNYLARLQLPEANPWFTPVIILHLVLTYLIVGLVSTVFLKVALVTMVAPIVQGNFQIPLAVTRILLGSALLLGGEFSHLEDTNKGTHVVQTLKALYIMLICQGTLYTLACLLESFSYFFRASLALQCGLVGKMGMESIGLYYEHAYDTFVQESVLDTKKMSLLTFSIDSLNADVTRDKKLAAVRILNSLLQQVEEASNRESVSQVSASTRTVTTLISMLGWTVPEAASRTEEKEVAKDADVRLFATKVVADLARYLRIVRIPSTMQMVSSLLDAENKPATEDRSAQIVEGNGGTAADGRRVLAKVVTDIVRCLRFVGIPVTMQMVPSLLDAENIPARGHNSAQVVEGNGETGDQEIRDVSRPPRVDGNRGTAYNQETEGNGGTGDQEITDYLIPPRVDANRGTTDSQEIEIQEMNHAAVQAGDLERGNADNTPQMPNPSSQASRDSERRYNSNGILKHVRDCLSIPRNSLNDKDTIPVLGVLILERLAYDVDNCAEISRSTEILPKIIGFISHISNTATMQQKQIITSSLTLVAKLASVKGAIGVTLRKDMSENPLLLSKLAEISEDSGTRPEQWKLTMDIIAKLAMDKKASQEIGGIQVIIATLMRTFLGRDETPNTSNDPSLRKAAGEALAMLSMDNAGNCSAMLNEPGYELIKDLMAMLLIRDPDGEYVYLAAILLQSMSMHSGGNLRQDQDPNERDPNERISYASTVLERIIKPDSEGKELEALIGLASQICKLFPGSITHLGILLPDAGVLAKKLVDELNANRRPSTEIPNMRRRLVELAISMVTLRPAYAEAFRNNGMLEALSIVERTPSKVERYRLFSGSVGLFQQLEENLTLSDLAADAKGLMIGPAAQAAQ